MREGLSANPDLVSSKGSSMDGNPSMNSVIRTVPEPVRDSRRYAATGNEYVALPEIGWDDAACYSLNVMTERARGLVEFRGGGDGGDKPDSLPLFAPWILADGAPTASWTWHLTYESGWLPIFTAEEVGAVDGAEAAPEALREGLQQGLRAGLRVTARYLTPPGEKGLILALEVENQGDVPRKVTFGWRFLPGTLAVSVFSRQPWGGIQRLYEDSWTRTLTWEGLAGQPEVALALRPPEGARWLPDRSDSGHPALGRAAASLCDETLLPQSSCQRAWMVGVNLDGDGAGLNAVHLARRGWSSLHEETTAKLADLLAQLPPAREEGPLRAMTVRNLLFSLHFSAGRTLDGEEWVLVTSRSPRYYVSAAHWSRDSLLWSFPAVLELSPHLAREWLLAAFRRYTRHPGVHAQYLDGRVLYPGFELDQLAAFWLALARYVRRTGDRSILTDPVVAGVLPTLESAAREAYDPAVGLLRTFLLPTDDPAPYPFSIYDNALFLVAWREREALFSSSGPDAVPGLLDRLRQSIYQHGVVPGPFGQQFAGATDGQGRRLLYDEPPGSLELLAYYGFCGADDPIYRNTVAWIHSSANPDYLPQSRFGHIGCPHAPYPWVLSWCNGLLSGRAGEVLPYLQEASLDGGFACETVDPQSGAVQTGAGFATCAGFLGYALVRLERGSTEWFL